jgi:uncharacterized protein YegL
MDNQVDIFGIDSTYADNALPEELESERQTLIGILIDESGSMHSYRATMPDCLENFRAAVKGAKESDEMLISVTRFNGTVTVGGYQFIDNINTGYSPEGMTRLYDCIVDSQRRLNDGKNGGYMEGLQANGTRIKAIICIFSDGEDTASSATITHARRSIEFLKSKEITVAFIAFGPKAHGIAEKLGIEKENILEVNATESDLRKVFTILSKSAISASKNAANGNNSTDFFTV